MAKFDAEEFGSVEYDFTPYGGVKRPIPDPSDEMIQTYHKKVHELIREHDSEDIPSEKQLRDDPALLKRVIERTRKMIESMDTHHRMVEIIAELCQEQPSAEEIKHLPYRVRVPFIRFVQREVINPEG